MASTIAAIEKAMSSPSPSSAPELALDHEVIPLPTKKSEITKMSNDDLDALFEQEEPNIPNWWDLSVDEKRSTLTTLYVKGAKKKAAPAKEEAEETKAPPKKEKPQTLLNDLLQQKAHNIENADDVEEIEGTIIALQEDEGRTDFEIGGYLLRLSKLREYGEGESFNMYVKERFGIAPRKAGYLMGNYSTLLTSGILWDDVSDLGWSKVKELCRVFRHIASDEDFEEQVKDWIDKARTANLITLEAMVKEFLAGDAVDTPDEGGFKSKVFKLPVDSLEVVDAAIGDAMLKGGTDHTGIALEYICTEFLGVDNSSKSSAQALEMKALQEERDALADQVAILKAEVEAKTDQLQGAAAAAGVAQIASGAQKLESVNAFWDWAKETYASSEDGGLEGMEILDALFGDDTKFAELFPSIVPNFEFAGPSSSEDAA